MNNIKLGDKSKVSIKWNVRPIDYSHEEEENIRVRFANKYGIDKDNVKVSPQFIQSNKNGEIVPFANDITDNIQDPKFQQQLFKSYLAEKKITDYDFDQILEIDNLINANINYDLYEHNKKYSIKWIKWSNFMSYGKDNFFDFTKLSGLVLLTSDPANQGGKTTFCLDLIRFLLFGKVTSREDDWTLLRVFNDYLPEETECNVEGCITIDGTDYVIKRTITRPKADKRSDKTRATNKVSYYKLVNDQYIDLKDEDCQDGLSTTETNKIIKDTIGNERDFDLMICVDSDNLKELISLKDTERGRLISRWIGLLPLEEKDKIARDTYNRTIVPSFVMNKYNKEELKDQNAQLKAKIEECDKVIDENKKLIEESLKKIDGYNNQKEAKFLSRRQVDPKLSDADVNTLEVSRDKTEKDGKAKKEEKERCQKRLDEIKNVEFNKDSYNALQNKKREIEKKSWEVQREVTDLKRDIEILAKQEYCPTCGARMKNNEDKIKEKKSLLEEANKRVETVKSEVMEVSNQVLSMEKNRELYEEKQRIDLTIQSLDAQMDALRKKYKDYNRTLKEIQAQKEAIEANNKIDADLRNLAENIKVEVNYCDRLKSINSDKTSEIKYHTTTIENNNGLITKIEKEEIVKKNWQLYLDIIGKNGISKMVLRTVLPMINGELKHLLSDVCDFDVEVEIDNRNDVNFCKVHDGVRANLSSGSGFEKTVASLALRSVLGKISSFSKPSFVIFDEILGGVADVNYDNLKLLYDKILPSYQLILEITHLKQIADWHKHTVLITKENNISKIKQC